MCNTYIISLALWGKSMKKLISTHNLNRIRENLISYTCDTLEEVNVQKLGFIRWTYGIIMQSLDDLYSGDISLAHEAGKYFRSDSFAYDCKLMNIDVELMLFIVKNPEKYLEDIKNYNEIACNSLAELMWGQIL